MMALEKLIAFARDGPNVKKNTILNELQQMIKDESVYFRVVHNAFGKRLEKYGKDVDHQA